MMSALETRHHDFYCLWCILAGTVAEIYILPENSGKFRVVAGGPVAPPPSCHLKQYKRMNALT